MKKVREEQGGGRGGGKEGEKKKEKGARPDEKHRGTDKDEVVLQMRNYSGDGNLLENRSRQL